MGQIAQLSGRRFGRLQAISYRFVPVGKTARPMVKWACLCDCGKEKEVLACHLTSGKTTSCGCLSAQVSGRRLHELAKVTPNWGAKFRKHGKSRTPEYQVWNEMLGRCHRLTAVAYKWYGARGISVCDRWRYGENGLSGFECFIGDMGPRPKGLSIDRINNDGNYEPSNCRWATQKEQMANTRPRVRKSAA